MGRREVEVGWVGAGNVRAPPLFFPGSSWVNTARPPLRSSLRAATAWEGRAGEKEEKGREYLQGGRTRRVRKAGRAGRAGREGIRARQERDDKGGPGRTQRKEG